MPRLIFLSPHFDDISFSLSGNYLKKSNSLIINIFTRSHYSTIKSLNNLPLEERIQKISETRELEDTYFCEKNSVNSLNVGLDDAGLHGDPFEIKDIEHDEQILERSSLTKILNKVEDNDISILFCPLAIGKHRNHLATFNFISKNQEKIERDGFIIVYYEDAPYSSYPENRRSRIKELQPLLGKGKYTRHSVLLSGTEIKNKTKNILIYKSQIEGDFDMRMYSPYSEENPTIHEAVWVKDKNLRVFCSIMEAL